MLHRALLPLLFILGFVAAISSSGCAHYRLGSGSKLTFQKLYVAPVDSEALAPQARALVSARVREAFLRDSRVILVSSPEEAEAVLHITLKKYGREATVSQEKDASLARKFALTLTASCDLRMRDGKELFTNREMRAERESYVDGGQLKSEYEMMPYLADSLATRVTHAVLDTW